MAELVAMIVHRPYVLAFLAGFLAISLAERGPLHTAVWLAIGTAIGWLAEFASVRVGVPFGMYTYHQENFPDELWIGDVPLFASLSFAFLSYFAWTTARTMLGAIEGRGAGMRRVDDVALDRSWRVAALAALITVWLDTVMDPLTLLGEHWFLGDLYHYHADGFHHGVPWTNYVGWFVTVFAICTANQLGDRLLGDVPPRGFALPYKPLLGIVATTGVFLFMLSVNAWMIATGRAPDAPLGEILLGGTAATGLFVLVASNAARRASSRPP